MIADARDRSEIDSHHTRLTAHPIDRRMTQVNIRDYYLEAGDPLSPPSASVLGLTLYQPVT